MISTPMLRALSDEDDLLDLRGLGDAERGGRLVEQHELLRPVGGARDGDALALAAGEVADGGVRARGCARRVPPPAARSRRSSRGGRAGRSGSGPARGRGRGSCRPSAGRPAPDPGRPPRCRGCAPWSRSPWSRRRRRSRSRRRSAGARPEMILISVDLPAPLSPTSATISPGGRRARSSRSATTPPKVLRMSRRLRTGGRARSSLMRSYTGQAAARRSRSRCVSTSGLPVGDARDADHIGAGDEGLAAEAEDGRVADLRSPSGRRRRSWRSSRSPTAAGPRRSAAPWRRWSAHR